ncbi:MAG: CoA pyrophosphatase [Psychromonas sp.]|nr:CoA pyrophosphatase [Psychromonas sp.]
MNKQTFLHHFLLYHPHHHIKATFNKKRGYKKAAILISLVERKTQLYVILTVRAEHLHHHAGQISFPGGGLEANDITLKDTALRETKEEIGIDANYINVFASLPKLITSSNYIVYPYLAFVDNKHHIKINTNEVQSTFEVPLSFLLNKDNTQEINLMRHGKPVTTYCIIYKSHLIWGVTAQIINTLSSYF